MAFKVLGHVSMSQELFVRLTQEQRIEVWMSQIRKLGVADSVWLPLPFVDDEAGTVGLNLLGFEREGEADEVHG
jgi:hypothetical protein